MEKKLQMKSHTQPAAPPLQRQRWWHLARERRGRPGQRRTADELLLQILFWNLVLLAVLATAGMAGFYFFAAAHVAAAKALGFGIGVAIVAGATFFSWCINLLIERFLRRWQYFAFPAGYILKLVLLLVILPVIRRWGMPDLDFLLLGFVLAIVLTLVVISVVILRADGPDFDEPSLLQ